jgi:predicted DNA-binding transcriptional regulator AlpA
VSTATETTPIAPVLLTDAESAALLRVGTRTFHDLRDEPWMPRAIVLGPRLLRWSRAELEAAVAAMPRQTQRSEPEELRRSRIDRLKAGA